MISRLRAALPLAGIVALAAVLRFSALGFGLPYPHARPDEETAVGHAIGILAGDLNPHFFHWPSLTLYLFAAAIALARTAGAALTPAGAVLLARALIAVAGTLTVLATAAIGRRLGGRGTGLAAALFLAVAPLHVRDSHFAMSDVLMTWLVMVSLALTMWARESPRGWTFAAAGAAGGLATSAKYSAAAILAVVATVPTLGAAAAFLTASAVGFVAATPFAVLDFPAFAADLAYDRAHLSGGHTLLLARGWLYHLQTTLPHGLGLATAAVAAIGLPLSIWKHGRKTAVLVAFAAAFYLSIGAGRTVFFRYAMPLVPVACVFAAVSVRTAGEWLTMRTKAPEPAVVALLAIGIALPALYQSVRLDRLLAREDSRVVAARWLAERLRPEHTLHDSGGDYSRLWLGDTPFHAWRYDPATRSFGDPAGATPDWIVLYESPLPEYTAAPESLQELVRTRYTLVYRVPGVPAETGEGVYDRQDAFFLPIDGFSGVVRPGPTVGVYRLR